MTVRRLQQAFTALVVFGPLAALAMAVARLWRHGVEPRDLVIAAVMYAVTGHGVTIGFHRTFTHRGMVPRRSLKVALAVAGSMAFEGGVVGWVSNHRQHHAYSDRTGDPHSPHRYGDGLIARARGLVHAHVGWFFTCPATLPEKYAPDMVADRDLVVVDKLFPLWSVVSLALPFAAGLALGGGRLSAGLSALLWGGLVRVCLLHHVTWSVNSVCHLFGDRPFRSRDRSTNFWPLALLSMGESWHNLHHAYPASARHGVDRGQVDTSAAIISVFERFGWVRDVRWPESERVAARRAA